MGNVEKFHDNWYDLKDLSYQTIKVEMKQVELEYRLYSFGSRSGKKNI